MDEHHETVTVTDYFGDKPRQKEVPVDSSMTLRANVTKMFKQYQKAGRGMGRVERQLKELDVLEEDVRGQSTRLAGIKDWDTWLAVSDKTEKRTPDVISETRLYVRPDGAAGGRYGSTVTKFWSGEAAGKTMS